MGEQVGALTVAHIDEYIVAGGIAGHGRAVLRADLRVADGLVSGVRIGRARARNVRPNDNSLAADAERAVEIAAGYTIDVAVKCIAELVLHGVAKGQNVGSGAEQLVARLRDVAIEGYRRLVRWTKSYVTDETPPEIVTPLYARLQLLRLRTLCPQSLVAGFE